MHEAKQVLDELKTSFEAFKKDQAGRVDALETKINRQALGLGGAVMSPGRDDVM